MAVQTDLLFTADLLRGITVTRLKPDFFLGDIQAHAFIIAVVRGGEIENLTGASITGKFIRPDNVTVPLTGTVDENGRAVLVLDRACYVVRGRFQLVISASVDSVISTIFAGIGDMLISQTDSIIDIGDVIPSLDELLAQIATIEAAVSNANAAAENANEAADRANNAQGPVGPTGATPNLTIGTVTTLAAGINATATITGTAEDPVLNLGIPKGADGNGILSVVQTTTSSADGGSNILTITEDDGTTSTFTVRNGSKGSTPVKGTDYYTPADQEAIVQQVISALGTPVFGRVDADNNIILSGELVNGTYTFKYEDADGNLTVIGSLNWDNVLYTNQIPVSTDTDGSIFNGTGYMEARRIGSTGSVGTLSNENASKAAFVTGFIPIKSGDVFRFKNCFICTQNVSDTSVYGIATWNLRIGYYGSSKEFKNNDTWESIATGTYASGVVDSGGLCRELTFNEKVDSSGYKYVRFSLAPDDVANVADAVITINELIE